MKPDLAGLLLSAMFVLLCIWMIYAVFRGKRSLRTVDENTAAVRENSELLRELIAVNRQTLESMNRSDT